MACQVDDGLALENIENSAGPLTMSLFIIRCSKFLFALSYFSSDTAKHFVWEFCNVDVVFLCAFVLLQTSTENGRPKNCGRNKRWNLRKIYSTLKMILLIIRNIHHTFYRQFYVPFNGFEGNRNISITPHKHRNSCWNSALPIRILERRCKIHRHRALNAIHLACNW